ncbi:MAG: kelch repeat-containing protein, partial [Chitinophagaceae bacterium]
SANCSTSKGIFYGGGENEKGISKKTGLLIWDNKKDSFQIKSLPDLPIPLANASCTHVGNMVYLAGGETTDAVSDLFLKLDLNYIEDGWKQLPSLPKQISHAVMLTQSTGRKDCIYLFGGRKKNASGISDLYNTVFEFDTRKNKWKQKESIPYSLSAGSGIATGTNNFLLFGGDKGQTFNQTEKLIHAINREKNENIKQELNKQKIELQTNHPGFSNEVLLYNVISNTWSVVGAIPFDTPVTTIACFWDKDIVIPNGEIKAGVRTPQLLIGNLISK